MVKQEKKIKEKPKYNTWQNIAFTISNMWKWDRLLVILCVLQAPLKVASDLSGLFVVRLVISLIENNSSAEMFILQIFVFCAAMFLLNIITNILSAKIRWRQDKIRFNYQNMANYKNMDADYENIESPDGLNKMQKAFDSIQSPQSATQNIINILVDLATSIVGFATLSAIITTLNPLLLIIITAVTLIQHFIHRSGNRWDYKNGDKWACFYRKLGYINNISGDFERAKDVRLYSLKPWLHDVFQQELRKYIKWEKTAEKHAFVFFDVSYAVIYLLICNAISFAYLIMSVLGNSMTIADAVFYFSAIGTFTGVLTGILFGARELNKSSLSICHLREFLDMPDKSNRAKGADMPESAVDIEFENVSFAYPKSEKNVLDNVAFKIKKGEKIAIVGNNGAGKTTLVKLLIGLYRPAGGNIKINGRDIDEYNRDEYYSIISPVFQDIYLFPVSIAQNIALREEAEININKLSRSIQFAGFQGKIDSLPEGYNTPLVKSVVDNAIELSGGEKQKLALARALYKDGLMLVLDEPTAALDPIAENEVYLKYNEFAKDKTSIFISHRLASTRFCDRIFFLDEGKITETGSHDELMAKNGKYAEIFNIQSHYYKEGATNEKA
ncbi:MAG: ABC transporter ATP-binding protein/permease [Oscillospiraceae bacterium]|nr:ABC transporter ATP-binding protein/permease [Oscillospiraceae bacterium]